MEDYYNVKRLALVLAKQAEVEGMKAANIARQQNDESMAYTNEDFMDKSRDFENLAHSHNEQL